MAAQDTTTAKLSQYFMYSTPVVEEKFLKNQIVRAKQNQIAQLTKEYLKSYSLVTNSLETKFGAAKTFIDISCDGKDDGNTKFQSILD